MKAISLEIESPQDIVELANILARLLAIDGIRPPFVIIHNVPDDFKRDDE